MRQWAKKHPLIKPIAITCIRWIFFAGSILFLLHFARESTDGRDLRELYSSTALLRTGSAALIISLAGLTSAACWNLLLAGLSFPAPLRRSTAVYCSTQIAKYLPGNVGHYIGRVALAKTRLHVPTASAILSILQETALACVAAVSVGFLCYFLLSDRAVHHVSRVGLLIAFAAIAITPMATAAVAEKLRARRGIHPLLKKSLQIIPQLRTMLRTLPLYVTSYFCIGAAVFLVASGLFDAGFSDFLLIAGAYSLAWIVGFVVPGVPGGLGIRESALVLLLAGSYPKDTVLMLALLARLASVAADLVMLVIGLLLLRATNFPHNILTPDDSH